MKFSLTDLAIGAKQALIDAEVGDLEVLQFYLTNKDTEEEIQLPMTPETFSIKTSANFTSYNIVELGEISFPRGERLMRVSWDGILPDAAILLQNVGNREAWDDPQEIIKDFQKWKTAGDKITLLITDTPINGDFYIKDFSAQAWHMGYWKYSIDFVAAVDLQVKTVEEVDKDRAEAQELKKRPRQKSKLGKHINQVDNIWTIGKILTGQGTLGDFEKVLGMSGLNMDVVEGIKDVSSVYKVVTGKGGASDIGRIIGKVI